MVKVSVIIPVYNAEKALKICIDSIINQSYKNFEVILVDDGSTDNSGNICDFYEKSDNRIRTIHKKNGGVSSARNVAIKESNGKYISFVDSDDYVDENFLQQLIDGIDDNVDMAVCGIENIIDYSKKVLDNNYKKIKMSRTTAYDEMIKNTNFYGYAWNKLYKKDIIINNNIFFDEEVLSCEDFEFVSNYLQYCNNISYLQTKLYFYYFDLERLRKTNRGYNKKQVSELKAYNHIFEIYKKFNCKTLDLVVYNYINIKLNVVYNLHLINKKPDFLLSTDYEKKIIKNSKRFSLLKKEKLFLACKFPLVSYKIRFIKGIIIKKMVLVYKKICKIINKS